MERGNVESLLAKLRESLLSPNERQTTLDAFRTELAPLTAGFFRNLDATTLALFLNAISDAPNDARRIIFQTLATVVEEERIEIASNEGVVAFVYNLIVAIETFLRTTLKLQSARHVSIPQSRSAADFASLPTSALRATAAALRTLHALIRVLPKREKISLQSSSRKHSSLLSLLDTLLPCLSAGLPVARHSTSGAIPQTSSKLQVGAFAWSQTSAQARRTSWTANDHALTRTTASCSPSCSAATSARRHGDHSSSGETEQQSDPSESERSDVSTASVASTSSRIRKDESRQREAMTKGIRKNALHCLIELNRHEARALVSRWSELLPDSAAPLVSSASAVPRLSSFSSPSASFSLCTLITQDPSTSVRIAAMSALESILSYGTLQFSIAQERNQRALSFTSLSSQLAAWTVNIRSYLMLALQRAASAPRPSTVGADVVGNFPSPLVLGLLQLARTFVMCTAKAKLATSNAAALSPVLMGFASHNDPDVQTAARRVIATLKSTAAVNAIQGGSESKIGSASHASSADSLGQGVLTVSTPTANAPLTCFANLLDEGNELTLQLCEQVISTFDQSETLPGLLPTWSVFVKRLAEAPVPLLNPEACSQLVAGWTGLCGEYRTSPDQRCNLLATVPDLCRVLTKHSELDAAASSNILHYVEACSSNADDAVRAAAVRVLGLLVLPSDSHSVRTSLIEAPVDKALNSKHPEHIAELLRKILWGKSDTLRDGALHDSSSLVRQRAAWALSNAMEARLRSASFLDEPEWLLHARHCLEAGLDIEGVAVSAFRACGSLLAMIPADASTEAFCLGRNLLEQLCMVLSTPSKPPKSRWNAASALERALGSELVFSPALQPPSAPISDNRLLLDRIVGLLCSNLTAKVFKVRVSATNALLSLCLGGDRSQESGCKKQRTELLGVARCSRIQSCAVARLYELAEAPQSKASALYVDELKCLLTRLVAACTLVTTT